MDYLQITTIIYLTIGVLILLLGILIFRENPNRRINRVTGIMMFLAALAPILGAFGLMIKKVSPTIEIDLLILNRIYLIWEFFFPQLLLFALIFPKENALLKNHPRVTPLLFIPHSIHFLIVLLFRTPESVLSLINFTETEISFLLQPFLIVLNLMLTLSSYLYEFHTSLFTLINLIYVLLAIFIMHQGYQKLQNPRMKKQVRLVLWGICISLGLYALTFLFPKLFMGYASENLNYTIIILALLVGAGSIALSIIKYQFLDIRLIIRRGIIFSVTSGLLVGIYLLLYGQAQNLFNAIFGINIPIVEIFFLVMAIIFFQPILSSIEETVEKVFVHEKYDYRNVLQKLRHDILHIIDIDQLKVEVVNTLSEAMLLENASLILKDDDSNYIIESNSDSAKIFAKDSEFISLINSIEDPITIQEITSRINSKQELQLIQSLNAYIFFPLSHHGELGGILCVGKKLTTTKFSAEDITMLRVLSDQMTITLENVQLYKERYEQQRLAEELSVAREIQRMLLPHEVPQGNNFEISAINIFSKEVGGDYYDFEKIDDRRIGIAIGDISGKGIPGAILMSNLQATFRAIAFQNLSPAEVMARVNNQIAVTTSAEKFATFFYGIFDSKKLHFTYTNAGHNYPILRKKTGECRYLLKSGLVIGVQKNQIYNETKVKLEPGDVLVLYTDGITEALNPEQDEFSEQQLLTVISEYPFSSAENLRNQIYDKLLDFTKGNSQYDDITLVVLQVQG